ncbi:hypothetical protein Bbelb_038940 [Branchiostoma belcheri]|nr:hypothetical protein Bbelb_038940 [Branchiostoma belcheri]
MQCQTALASRPKLAITLRFLATGNSYRSLEFAFRAGACSAARRVPGSEVTASLRRTLPNGARSDFKLELKSIRRPLGAKSRSAAVGKPAGLRPGPVRSIQTFGKQFPEDVIYDSRNPPSRPDAPARYKSGDEDNTVLTKQAEVKGKHDVDIHRMTGPTLDYGHLYGHPSIHNALVTTRRTCICVLSTCKNVGKRRASVRGLPGRKKHVEGPHLDNHTELKTSPCSGETDRRVSLMGSENTSKLTR